MFDKIRSLDNDTIDENKSVLEECVSVLKEDLDKFITTFISPDKQEYLDISIYEELVTSDLNSTLYHLHQKLLLNHNDIALLIFAYAWEYEHTIFNGFIINNEEQFDLISQFQGFINKNSKRFIPYFDAFLSLYFPKRKQDMLEYFINAQHPFIQKNVITLNYLSQKDEVLGKSASIPKISEEFATYIHGGEYPLLDKEIGFPARFVKSSMLFKEVILTNETQNKLAPFITWLKIQDKIKNYDNPQILKKIKTNRMYVFSGPPGTGKTLTATTLGQEYGMDTYVLDMSKVVSKYIGEFQKSMERVFQKLHGQNVILFIDEADALFSKRSEEITDAKDKYANQEMSYILQRIEKFDGVVILATNVRDIRTHFDKAMIRRVSDIIEFGFPLEAERLQLWKNTLIDPFSFINDDLEKLSEEFQVSGADITATMSNVLTECIEKDIFEINYEMVEKYLEKEFYKKDARFGICRDSASPALLMEQRLGRTAVHTGKRM